MDEGFNLPDPETLSLAECGEWVSRFMWAFHSKDERGEFARKLGLRISALAND